MAGTKTKQEKENKTQTQNKTKIYHRPGLYIKDLVQKKRDVNNCFGDVNAAQMVTYTTEEEDVHPSSIITYTTEKGEEVDPPVLDPYTEHELFGTDSEAEPDDKDNVKGEDPVQKCPANGAIERDLDAIKMELGALVDDVEEHVELEPTQANQSGAKASGVNSSGARSSKDVDKMEIIKKQKYWGMVKKDEYMVKSLKARLKMNSISMDMVEKPVLTPALEYDDMLKNIPPRFSHKVFMSKEVPREKVDVLLQALKELPKHLWTSAFHIAPGAGKSRSWSTLSFGVQTNEVTCKYFLETQQHVLCKLRNNYILFKRSGCL